MIFTKIVGGPNLKNIGQFEVVLHDATLKYSRPSASEAGLSPIQVVNYLNRKHKFESDEYGRGVYQVDGGAWEYFRVLPFLKRFPHTVGYFRFDIYITRKDEKKSLSTYLESYLTKFLTQQNEGIDDPDDEDFVRFPTFKNIKISETDAIYYRLNGVPNRFQYKDYYVIPINNEYMVNVEIAPRANGGGNWTKVVSESNLKAAQIIVDSLELKNSKPHR